MRRQPPSLVLGLSLALLSAMPLPAKDQQDATALASSEESQNDILITARKRSETLQNVPLSVSALDADDLAVRGTTDVNGLFAQVPGLFTAPGSVNNSADFAYLTMRGIGFNAGLEPAVGVFIDGMYMPQLAFDTAFLDLERVEVLRGPQGTLFGRNTQGGAIAMLTRTPGPETRGKIRFEFARFGTLRGMASLSGRIAGDFYAGVSAEYSRTDGFIDNIILGGNQDWSKQFAMRGVIRWQPSNAIEARFIADISTRDYNEAIRGVRLADSRFESLVDQDAPDSKDNHGIQLNISAKLGDRVTFVSISGYRYVTSSVFTDVDSRITVQNSVLLPAFPPTALVPQTVVGATLDLGIQQRFISQELRLSGDWDRADWLAGLYFFDQSQNQQRQRRIGAGVRPIPTLYFFDDFQDDRHGYAGFGQLSYRFTTSLEITFGGRWSHESVTGTGDRSQVFGPPINRQIPLVRDASDQFGNFSWMGSLAWTVAPDVLLYATYAQGWKAGGINRFPGNAAGNLPYKDESSENFELGLKSALLDNQMTFNAAAYHIRIRDQQLLNVIPDPAGGPTPVTVVDNAANSHVTGFEAELIARPTQGLQLSGALSLSYSQFDNFVRVFSATDFTDFSGTRFENVPETTLFLAARYSAPMANGQAIEFYGEYRHVSAIITQDNTRASLSGDQLTAPGYDRVDMHVTFIPSERFRVTAFVNNLLDSFDYAFPSSDPLIGGDVFVAPLPPRQFGIRMSFGF